MTHELDRTQQRILGVLVEKELAVPDTYPLTENALLAGCNQKSNRDPEMGLEIFALRGALVAMMAADWAKTASSTGGYATRYAHRLDSHYALDDGETAILCELLVRGPQAPGALKPRVARLKYHANPETIEEVLYGLASRPSPLVEQLPRRPRERDHRWCHLLGPSSHEGGASETPPPSAAVSPADHDPHSVPIGHATANRSTQELLDRIDGLEVEVAELKDEVRRLRDGQ